MMRLRTAVLAGLLLAPVMAQAQNNYPSAGGATVPTSVAMCLNSSGQAVPLFNASGTWQCAGAAIPITGAISATTAATASSTLPSLSAGTQPLYESLSGGLYVQSVYGTTIVDITHGLPVQPQTGSTWTVSGASASGAALSGNPVRIGMSDGTNAQNWLAAIALADGVNGNNTGAVANWLWNGATYDRQPGTTKGSYQIIRDAAGNARGANVDANNNLGVVLPAETTKVLGTVRALGNLGGAFDAATGAAPPANAVQIGTVQSGATGGFLKAPIVCDNYVYKHVTSATDTLAVQGVASQTIYVCGYEAFFAGTATFFLENTASANANCSSSNTQIAILVSGTAQSGIVSRAPFWNGLKNTSGNGLCINSTGTGGFDIGVYYAQF